MPAAINDPARVELGERRDKWIKKLEGEWNEILRSKGKDIKINQGKNQEKPRLDREFTKKNGQTCESLEAMTLNIRLGCQDFVLDRIKSN